MSREKVLLCMICRDSAKMLPSVLVAATAQMEALSDKYEFSASFYENDSSDSTKEAIEGWEKPSNFGSMFAAFEITDKVHFPSVVSKERINQMAAFRNAAMDQVSDLDSYDYVVWFDADYVWEATALSKLLGAVGEGGFADMASGYSLHADIQRPHMELFDKWATRGEELDIWWTCTPFKFLKDEAPVYSTFNGLCAYKAQPFIDGLRFSSSSKHQETDVEHVSICEGFRDAGFGRIYLLKNVPLLHFMNTDNFAPWAERRRVNKSGSQNNA